MIDYIFSFGLPGLLVGVGMLWILTRKVHGEKRKKVLKIGSVIFLLPLILDWIFFGPRSLLSLAVYGAFGIAGLILAGLCVVEKLWINVVLYLAPMISVITIIAVLGP